MTSRPRARAKAAVRSRALGDDDGPSPVTPADRADAADAAAVSREHAPRGGERVPAYVGHDAAPGA